MSYRPPSIEERAFSDRYGNLLACLVIMAQIVIVAVAVLAC